LFLLCSFFFQAEDAIRDFHVTGVQTCALPIFFALSGCRRGKIPFSILEGRDKEALAAAEQLLSVFGKSNFALEMDASALPRAEYLNLRLNDLAEHLRIPIVATADVHYATKDDFYLHDLLTCVRTGTTLSDVHPDRRLNAEN